MKSFTKFIFFILVSVLLSGCGMHSAMVSNINSNVTNVELSRKNFKIVDKVSGQSTATYILGIGGLSNKALIEKAKANMLSKAELTGSAKAIVNVTTESHVSIIYPFFFQRTVTVSGHIIEFTD